MQNIKLKRKYELYLLIIYPDGVFLQVTRQQLRVDLPGASERCHLVQPQH